MGKAGNTYKILVGKPQEKKNIWETYVKLENNPVVGSCENFNLGFCSAE
jgi:hypothetical protein